MEIFLSLFEAYLLVFYALAAPSIDGVERIVAAQEQGRIAVLADG